MAYSVKANDLSETGELHANKVVIITGPSFGTGLKLVLFGAVLGAGAVLYWKNIQDNKPASAPSDETSEALTARLHHLAERAKSLASRASEAIHSAAEVAAPALQNALKEAKQAAREAEAEIQDELRELREIREQDDKPEQV